jgi:hypothetical protein
VRNAYLEFARKHQEPVIDISVAMCCAADAALTTGSLEFSDSHGAQPFMRRTFFKDIAGDSVDRIGLKIARRLWQTIVRPAKEKFRALPSEAASRLGLSEGQRRVIEDEIEEIVADLSKEPDYS